MSAPADAAPEPAPVAPEARRSGLGWLCAGAAALGAISGAVAAAWWPPVGVHIVLLVLTVGVGVPASWVDLREHRLPDRITWPYAAAAAAAVGAAAAVNARPQLVLDAALGAVATTGVLYVMAVVASLGLGDVKYGLGLGLCAGTVAVSSAAVLPVVAMLLATPVAVVSLVRHGAAARLPMGPALGAAGVLLGLGFLAP